MGEAVFIYLRMSSYDMLEISREWRYASSRLVSGGMRIYCKRHKSCREGGLHITGVALRTFDEVLEISMYFRQLDSAEQSRLFDQKK